MNESIDESFLRAVEPLRPALRLHCYRMLGSSSDSDDVMQEVLLRAWRAKHTLENEAAMRGWLYRIATNACLDELHDRKARPLPSDVVAHADDPTAPPTAANPEITWLEPFPDTWLAGVTRDPGSVYEIKESVALAFVAALQCLSARERAVVLLRDVLGLSAEETAGALEMTLPAANSTLHRARTALRERVGGDETRVAVDATSEVDHELLRKYIEAWDSLDLPLLVTLLNDDIVLSMPPSPTWFEGKDQAAAFFGARPFALLARGALRIVPLHANGQPALAFFVDGALHGLHVLRLGRGSVLEIHHFRNEQGLAAFELTRTSP